VEHTTEPPPRLWQQ